MPWNEVTIMSLKEEFVTLATLPGANISELARRFSISRKTAYKWLSRYQQQGLPGLAERSRKPLSSPSKTADDVELKLITLRQRYPAWGPRKLKRYLENKGESVPAVATVAAILKRHHLIEPQASLQAQHWQRFEHPHPNDLWQMDFKGWFYVSNQRCFPLTILDDHSRFSLCLRGCQGESHDDVKPVLIDVFRHYGLPVAMTMDNGAPWGVSRAHYRFTRLSAWLIHLGIRVSHSRPHHPQTQGKDERFHRSLKAEVLNNRAFSEMRQCQTAFDSWRRIYNCKRPHDALSLEVPISRYQISQRAYPETLPAIEYDEGLVVRKVQMNGHICLYGKRYLVSNAFWGYPVLVKETADEYERDIYFTHQRIAKIDLRRPLD
ncbi:IS481 family transposase [Pragia fontium]|nr:IS481 family transposase [Pragia fontium]VEJ52715.1 Transposase and inactivated derivatives [Pragia fontium]VEJ53960.1 Transposase and inactivated derivatives [Pragia fontium]VEJ55142.1 Transposase and inactivated derivatives [Pragia fontium]VEJ55733.1 Transposase and inactivated derivatives [Pragia fontium]